MSTNFMDSSRDGWNLDTIYLNTIIQISFNYKDFDIKV